jgi:hypothetical protein
MYQSAPMALPAKHIMSEKIEYRKINIKKKK